MGAAFFIVLNSEDPGFDTSVDGKALSRHSVRINSVAAKLRLKALEEYSSQSHEDARAMMASLMGLENEDDLPPDAQETLANMPPEQWYDADQGIEYAKQMADHIRQNPQAVKDADAVLYDFDSMLTVLKKAKEHKLKWHLQVDF